MEGVHQYWVSYDGAYEGEVLCNDDGRLLEVPGSGETTVAEWMLNIAESVIGTTSTANVYHLYHPHEALYVGDCECVSFAQDHRPFATFTGTGRVSD